MRVVLERAVALGGTWVAAALVRQTIHSHATTRHLSFTADKRPAAILLRRGDQLSAFTPSGEPMAADEVERLCPGATTRFLRGGAP